MNSITTHVLDTARGKPATGVPVLLERRRDDGSWAPVGHGKTDDDGRLRTLVPTNTPLSEGVYRLTFDTEAYFGAIGVEGFFPEAVLVFRVRDASQHHHVPLLLSPFGLSTYRGS